MVISNITAVFNRDFRNKENPPEGKIKRQRH